MVTKINSESGGNNGVLYTYGNSDTGLVLYVKNGVPHFEYNYFGNINSLGKRYRIVASQALTTGASTVKFQFDKTGKLAGVGRLFINDRLVGWVDMPNTVRGRLSHEGSGIGKKWAMPVSPDVADINEFDGIIENVNITVKSK